LSEFMSILLPNSSRTHAPTQSLSSRHWDAGETLTDAKEQCYNNAISIRVQFISKDGLRVQEGI